MLINSELPNQMLKHNTNLNQYDFVLFHLFRENDFYRKYFLDLRKSHIGSNRTMILDNSAYEFFIKGEELDLDKYKDAILELDPDYYILPDTLMDINKTLTAVKNFVDKYNGILNCFSGYNTPIAVIQGNTEDEMIKCFHEYVDMGLNHIAIPFHNSFFKELGGRFGNNDSILHYFTSKYNVKNPTEDMLYAAGRIRFISKNINKLSGSSYIHLLGSHCILEKNFLKVYDVIKTMDTGYPVKCAMEHYELFNEPHKPHCIIDEFINKDISKSEEDLIRKNMERFISI